MTADPYQAAANGANNPADPGSWNRYAYVENDPMNFSDPQGLFLYLDSDGGSGGTDEGGGGGSGGGGDGGFIGLISYFWPFGNGGSGGGLASGGSGGGLGVSKPYSKSINCNKTPAQLIADMESNFASFANYSGTFGPAGFPLGAAAVKFSGTVALGSTINISDVNTFVSPTQKGVFPVQVLNVAVQVTAVSATSFTFTTLPGHVLYPGTISFSAIAGVNGQLTFAINVDGNISSLVSTALYYSGGYNLENNIWNNTLASVKNDCSR
jgi:hypothetical protein